MSLMQVRVFLACTQAGSITRAADMVGLSQPAMSEQVRKLEHHLGVALFTRSKGGLRLTEAGERFLPHAQAIGADVADAEASVRGVSTLQEGSLAFGLFNSGLHVLSGLVPSFRSRYPGITLRIVGANSAQVADLVRGGELEAGVVALPVEDRGLVLSDVLWSCEAAYFHRDPTVTAAPVTIADLISRPLVLHDASWSDVDPTRRQLAGRAQTSGLQLRPDIEVESATAALAIAASGVAGTVASVPVAEELGYGRSLHRASLDPPLIETFAFVSRDPRTLSPASRAMLDLVQQHMRMLHTEVSPG